MTIDGLSMRTQNCLRRAELTDFWIMKFMDREHLYSLLKPDIYFGRKSWNELQDALDRFPSAWFEFCL